MPSSRQLREVSDALADFYAPGLLAESYVDRAFALTSRLVPIVLNSMGVMDVRTGGLQANFDRHLPGLEDAFSAFGGIMHRHQFTRFDPATNGGKPFSVDDFYGRSQLHDLDLYQEVYRPMGFQDHCFVHIRTNPSSTVFIGFFRDQGNFTKSEKDILEILQPHLANGRWLASAATAVSEAMIRPEVFARSGYTPRESDVIHWLVQGKSNEEIAEILHIRPDSVSRNLQAIYIKMGVDHRVAAAIHALTLARKIYSKSLLTEGGAANLRVQTGIAPWQ